MDRDRGIPFPRNEVDVGTINKWRRRWSRALGRPHEQMDVHAHRLMIFYHLPVFRILAGPILALPIELLVKRK
jgi:hypothetical protein